MCIVCTYYTYNLLHMYLYTYTYIHIYTQSVAILAQAAPDPFFAPTPSIPRHPKMDAGSSKRRDRSAEYAKEQIDLTGQTNLPWRVTDVWSMPMAIWLRKG